MVPFPKPLGAGHQCIYKHKTSLRNARPILCKHFLSRKGSHLLTSHRLKKLFLAHKCFLRVSFFIISEHHCITLLFGRVMSSISSIKHVYKCPFMMEPSSYKKRCPCDKLETSRKTIHENYKKASWNDVWILLGTLGA